jgi:hypothetical protein
LLFAFAFALAVSGSAAAQTAASDTSDTRAQVRVYASGGRSLQNWHGQATLQSVNFEFARPYRKHSEIGLIFAPHIINQPRSWFGDLYHDGEENVRAVSASMLYRRQFQRESKKAQPFIEISTGPMWAEKRVPAATSRFNFISQAGFGYVFRPDAPVSFVLGYRFAHISNGGYAPRNPGLNINSIMIGTRLR